MSWYSRVTGAARVSVVDTEAGRYGHLALVAADGKPIKTHAGGLAWREDLLYAADTMNGLRVFDLARIKGDDPPPGRSLPAGREGAAFLLRLGRRGSGRAARRRVAQPAAGARLVRWPFAPGGLLAQEPASDAWVTAHANLQGALVLGGRLLLAESQARILPGTLWASPFAESVTKRRWANGCEDLASVGGEVVSVTEHPDLMLAARAPPAASQGWRLATAMTFRRALAARRRHDGDVAAAQAVQRAGHRRVGRQLALPAAASWAATSV